MTDTRFRTDPGIVRRLSILLSLMLIAGCTKLGALNAVLPKDDATRQVIEGIAYGDAPGMTLDVYLPVTPESGTSPVVMFIYGGSWKDGRRQDYEFVGRALNARGYIAVLPDYRKVPEVLYPEFVLDGARALRWVHENIAQYGGDPEALFLSGHSAGAYNAVMLTVADDLLAEHGLPVPPVRAFAGLAGPYDFLPLRSRPTRDAFGHVEDLDATQPVNLIDSDTPPLLLLHGTTDKLVWVNHSRSLHNMSTQVGAESTLTEYDDVGHVKLLLSLSKPLRDDPPAFEDMMRFFDQYR